MKWLDGWFFRHVDMGDICPRGYGLAWRGTDYGRNGITVCPLPFNVLIGFCRWAYYALMRGFPLHHNDKHGGRNSNLWRCCVCWKCGETLQPTAEERADGGPYG